MPNSTPTQTSVTISALPKSSPQQHNLANTKKPADYPSKNTTIIVITCVIVTILVVLFSMFYMAQLKNNMIFSVQEAVENIGTSTTETTTTTDSATSTDPVTEHTVTVQIESSNLLSADYLAVVLPILISLAGAYIVFLGMNRLKMYDERIDSTRSDLLGELNTIVQNQVIAGQAKQIEAVENVLKNQRIAFNDEVSNAASELANLAAQHIQDISDAGSGYDWLKAAIEKKEMDVTDVHTVFDAHKLVELLRAEKPDNYIPLIKEVVQRVTSQTLSGDATDYHNLSAELARGSMYQEANLILTKGLSFFPTDTDLLSDYISYATKGGMLDDAKIALDRLNKINRRLWTWRCYIFISDYHRATGNLEAALEMCDACITAIPTSQTGYHDKAEVVKMITPGMDGIKQSIAILRSALDTNINCPQCSNMLGKTYMELGEYENALSAFDRAILDLAEGQPGVNESFVFYNRASCYDRMFVRTINSNAPDVELLVNAHNDYVTALQLGELTVITKNQTLNRLKFLGRYLPNDEQDQ